MESIIVTGMIIAAHVVGFTIIATRFKRITIYEFQTGLKFFKGKLVKELGAGSYRYYPPTTSISVYDKREQILTLPGQEMLSKDNVAFKITLAVSFKVADAKKAHMENAGYYQGLYLMLQLLLREAVAARTMEELLDARDVLGSGITEKAGPEAARLGLEVVRVAVKDITFPGELKKIFTEVVRARQEGLAALERARGEDAAMRKLANTARMLEGNPALLQMRMLQALENGSGNVISWNLPDEMAAAAVKKTGGK